MSRDVVIVSAARTPFGRFGGLLRDYDCYDLSAIIIEEVIKRIGLNPAEVDEVNWGMGDTSSCKDVFTPVVARQALLKAGLPHGTTSCTLDKACISGSSAVHLGLRAIKLDEADVAIGGGVTTFSSEPFILRKVRWEAQRIGDITVEDPLYMLGYKDYNPVSVDASEVALKNGISREEQDRWAYHSHMRYGEALKAGRLGNEIKPMKISLPRGEFKNLDYDEQYRANISLEKLAQLPTVYGSLTVTAGNAPGLNDGAAAVVIMSKDKADMLGFEPLATIEHIANAALSPNLIAEVPAAAIAKALNKMEMTTDDLKLIEINEAFAAMPLVSTKILANGDMKKVEELRNKTNVNGGAIAIGHPNCASGARIIMTLAYELRRRGGGYGVAAICGGLAQGDAVIIKV